MNKVKFVLKILLVVYFIAAICLTFISQKNYERKLVKVEACNCESSSISHNVEYMGKLKPIHGSYEIVCDITDYKKEIKECYNSGELTDVLVSNISIVYGKDKNEKIKPGINIIEEINATINSCSVVDDKLQMKIFIRDLPDSWELDQEYIIKISFFGTKRRNVVPSSSIISINEQDYVFVIEETPKIWGTEYSVHRELVKVVESNGELKALNSLQNKKIIKYANKQYYEGMLIELIN